MNVQDRTLPASLAPYRHAAATALPNPDLHRHVVQLARQPAAAAT